LGDTAATPVGVGNVGSCGTTSGILAAKTAAEDEKQQLFEIAARELGVTAAVAFLPFEALTAIHVVHRVAAAVVLAALAALAWRLHASGDATLRRYATGLALLALWQLATGLSNVVLGWPLVAAVAHTGGAAGLVLLLAYMLARVHIPAASATRSASRAVHRLGV
jgi:cytochrome c oxidase assembly protein subunit 15